MEKTGDDYNLLARRRSSASPEKRPHRKPPSSERRVMGKNGDAQVAVLNVPNKHKRFSQDFFNTMIDCPWRYTLLVFLLSHFISWFVFAVIWYCLTLAHGDFEEREREPGETTCIINVQDPTRGMSFINSFIFSMESQTTIGYGTAYPSDNCPQAVVVLCFQSVCGMIIEAFSVGIVFAKMTRPHLRTQTLLFSNKAVVAVRDGCLTLMFRVGDIRKSQLVSTKLWVLISGFSDPDDPEMDQTELAVTFNGSARNLSTCWPTTVQAIGGAIRTIRALLNDSGGRNMPRLLAAFTGGLWPTMHRIDERSPLYRMDPRDLLEDTFEILVFLEGTIQATGQTTQARTSYGPHEIMWGHKLYPMLRYSKKLGRYEADFNRFHQTVEVETPLCSSHNLNRVRRLSELSVLHPISEGREETAVEIESPA